MRFSTRLMAGCLFAGALPIAGSAGSGITSELIISGLTRPVLVTHAGGDCTRIFVVEQSGRILVYDITVDPPALLGTFLDIEGQVGDTNNEQGLLGLAFHPGFLGAPYFYVNYTNNNGDTHISRFTVPADTPNAADPNSEVVILSFDQPRINHNGGWMAFGPSDGYLYIASGDGGGMNDEHGIIGNGQDVNSLLGKILRIDVDGNDSSNGLYGIPPDNPFAGVAGPDEIWQIGLRNPWRNSFDPLTGDLYIADVGQGAWEEINFQPAGSLGGENWGWRCREGTHDFNFETHCSTLPLIDPIHEYSQGGSPYRCAITGGEVYRGCAIPSLYGAYFFADYCSRQIWTLVYDGSSPPQVTERTSELAPGGGVSIGNISSFGRDAFGELYICDLDDGEVFRILPGP